MEPVTAQMTREQMRAARARHKSKGGAFVKAMRDGHRRMPHPKASELGASVRRSIGDATFDAILEQAQLGATLEDAMQALGLSENGIRKNLRTRLGSGGWPPKTY